MMRMEEVKNVTKIAVLRANALGDFIVTLPALQALRAKYPSSEIILLGKPWHHEFVKAGRTPVDRVIVVPVKKGVRDEVNGWESEDDLDHFFSMMQQEKIDIAISMQGRGIAANPFMKRLGARLTIGTCSPESEKPDRSIPFYYYQSEVMRYLELVQLAGAQVCSIEPILKVLPEDKEEIKTFSGQLRGGKYILINPVANDIRRMWPLDNYPALADHFAKRGFQMVFTGSSKDAPEVESIINRMSSQAINACGLTFGGLAALASEASLMISPDTGPLHLSQAVGCATVGIYWAPNIINWGPVTRSRHRPVMNWKLECPLCGIIPNDPYPFEPSAACRHEISFVSGIPERSIREAAESLLQTSDSGCREITKRDIIYS